MPTMMMESAEMMVMAPLGLTELVRGDDQRLVDRVLPLVQSHNIALNLEAVERIDAAGITALISLYGSARNAGHAFAVCNVSAHVGEILRLVGLENILISHNAVRNAPCEFVRNSAA